MIHTNHISLKALIVIAVLCSVLGLSYPVQARTIEDRGIDLQTLSFAKLNAWSCQTPERYTTPPASPDDLADYYYDLAGDYSNQGNISNAAPCYQQAAETATNPRILSGAEYATIALAAMKNNADGGRNQDIRLYVPKAEQAAVPYKNFTGEQYYNAGNAFYAACPLSRDRSGNSGDATKDINCKRAYRYLVLAQTKGFSAATNDLVVLLAAFNKAAQKDDSRDDSDALATAACPEDTPCRNHGCDVIWGIDDFPDDGIMDTEVDSSSVYANSGSGGGQGRSSLNSSYGAEVYSSPKKYYDRALYYLKKNGASGTDGVILDDAARKRAVLCLKQASSLGYAPAQTELALLYRRGDAGNINFSNVDTGGNTPHVERITSENYAAALKLLERAVAQNYAPAYYQLGLAYVNGQGVWQDYRLGISLLKVAAGYIQTPRNTENPFPLKPFQDGYDKYVPLVCVPPLLWQPTNCFTPSQEICRRNSLDGNVLCRYAQNPNARICNQRGTLCEQPSRNDLFNPAFLKQSLPNPMPATALYKIYQPLWQAQQALSNAYSRGTGVAKTCATSQFFWETGVRRHLAENRENNIPDDASLRIDMIRLYRHSTVTDAQGKPIKNRYTLSVQDENGNNTSYNNVVETEVSTSTDGSSIGEYLDAWLPQNNRNCREAAQISKSDDTGYFDALYWVQPAR